MIAARRSVDSFGIADYEPRAPDDNTPCIYCLKHGNTASGNFEVQVIGADAPSSLLDVLSTPISLADATNFVFLADFPGVYCLKRANTDTGTLEVNLLGGSDFRTLRLHHGTVLQQTLTSQFEFTLGHYTDVHLPDIICLQRYGTLSGHLEVSVIGGYFDPAVAGDV